MYESLVAISKEAAGSLEFKLISFINMKLNLKQIESIYNTNTLSNRSEQYEITPLCCSSSV